MVRKRVRTTNRGENHHILPEAAKKVLEEGKSVRSVAREFKLRHQSLNRYCHKLKNSPAGSPVPTNGYSGPHNLVFSDEQEKSLIGYLEDAAAVSFGLTSLDIRKFAARWALSSGVRCPKNWRETNLAGKDWLSTFLKRHPNALIRKSKVGFQDKVSEILKKNEFEQQNIFCMDEAWILTGRGTEGLITDKGQIDADALMSQEQGTLATCVIASNSTGNNVPPFFIFPGSNFEPRFIQQGPPGSKGFANRSGWLKEDEFIEFLKHFSKHAKPRKEEPILLLLNSLDCHLSIEVLDICKDAGITLLSLPSQIHRKSEGKKGGKVKGHFQDTANTVCDAWCLRNPGESITFNDVSTIASKALPCPTVTKHAMSMLSNLGVTAFQGMLDIPPQGAESSDYKHTVPGTSALSSNAQPFQGGIIPSMSNASGSLLQFAELSAAAGVGEARGLVSHSDTPSSSIASHLTHTLPSQIASEVESTDDESKRRRLSMLADILAKNAQDGGMRIHEFQVPDVNRKQFARPTPTSGNPGSGTHMFAEQEVSLIAPTGEACLHLQCLVCRQISGRSDEDEAWVQCCSCRDYAHEICASQKRPFVCPNCEIAMQQRTRDTNQPTMDWVKLGMNMCGIPIDAGSKQ